MLNAVINVMDWGQVGEILGELGRFFSGAHHLESEGFYLLLREAHDLSSSLHGFSAFL